MDELKLTSNTEELKAKEYASVVERLQVAIKREQQIKVLKQVNEKQKQVSVYTIIKYKYLNLMSLIQLIQFVSSMVAPE